MVGLVALALAAAHGSPARHVEAPLAEAPLPSVGFSCLRSDGLPTLRMDGPNARHIWYNQSGDPRVVFFVSNPTGSAVYNGDDRDGQYLLTIEGTTEAGTGVANGIPVRIQLTIRLVAGHLNSADYIIQAGAFTRRETMCGTMPMMASPARTAS